MFRALSQVLFVEQPLPRPDNNQLEDNEEKGFRPYIVTEQGDFNESTFEW